jgi:hypothetical protein
MSISNMVAESKKETDKNGVPTFDAKDVVTWSKKMKIYLMKKKRNHLGLETLHWYYLVMSISNSVSKNVLKLFFACCARAVLSRTCVVLLQYYYWLLASL